MRNSSVVSARKSWQPALLVSYITLAWQFFWARVSPGDFVISPGDLVGTAPMAFLRALGSFWATPQQPAAPSLVPSTSPLARLSRTEQRDQLLDQLAELDAELAADEEYVPQKRARFTVPEEEDSSEDLADDAPAPEKSNRERTIYEKVPEEKHIVVDGTAVTDPAVAAALKKLFAKDNAGYKPAKYYPNKAEARRVWVKCRQMLFGKKLWLPKGMPHRLCGRQGYYYTQQPRS